MFLALQNKLKYCHVGSDGILNDKQDRFPYILERERLEASDPAFPLKSQPELPLCLRRNPAWFQQRGVSLQRLLPTGDGWWLLPSSAHEAVLPESRVVGTLSMHFELLSIELFLQLVSAEHVAQMMLGS